MDDNTNSDQAVDEAVDQAQKLDDWKQKIRADMQANGEDPDEVRIIIGHKVGDTYTATEIQGYPTD